jgi:hypothetical protein
MKEDTMHLTPKLAALAILAVALVSLVGCQPTAQPPAAPAAPDYAAELGPKVDTFFEVWNDQGYDKLDGIMAENFIRRAPDQDADGREAMKAFMQQVHATYPDFRIVKNHAAYAKDLAFTQWTVTGTFTAEGAAPASVEVSGATMLRFANGMATEEHAFYDTAALIAQTGATSLPHASAK